MNWQHFQTYNEAETRAFEAMCNQLFELWVNRNYQDKKLSFVVVNGAGGDGGVESFVQFMSGEEIGVQAKWFPDNITTSQFHQIKSSILTALEVHSKLIKYIVCVPRDLSNLKKGKDGKIVQESEYSKWNKIVKDIKDIYPQIDIVFWGNHRIMEQLQYAEAAGVRRYWFEKEELTTEALQCSFDKQKSGWLVQRYISVLHNRGRIHEEISNFLGEVDKCTLLLRELDCVINAHKMLIDAIDILCIFLSERKLYIDKIKDLEELKRLARLQLNKLLDLKINFRYERKIEQWEEHIFTYEKLEDLVEWLDENSYKDGFWHFGDVEKLIEKIKHLNFIYLLERLKQRSNYEKIIITGEQGTGKTHGIANEIEIQLEKNYHIPILIQAKSVKTEYEWKDILIRVLGLSQSWSEEELWSALEALSYRNEAKNPLHDTEESEIRIVPKVIICVDGIDEIRPYSSWIDRINQVNAIISRHPRIRFCFTGRPYAFDWKKIVGNANLKIMNLKGDGDVPVRTIYDDYIRYYDVNDEGAKWLRYTISTPYALKLVCELYENKDIGLIEKSDIIVTNLLMKKFDKLNEEFKTTEGFEENRNDQIIKIVLLKINELFESQEEVSKEKMKSILRELNIYYYLQDSGLEKVLNFLEKHSFLQSYQRQANSFFEEDEIVYMLGVQPVYDYLKALRLFEKSSYSDDLEIDVHVMENTGALQMYSVMVLDCYGLILWNNKSCCKQLDKKGLFNIVAYALINVNEKISGKYVRLLEELMGGNAHALSLTVNRIILPLARQEKHPLGSMLLDRYLSSFDKAAIRDCIWSIPSGISGNEYSIWRHHEDINYQDESYKLEKTDNFIGMPLVWAWGLTSVNNNQRTMIRKELIQWGIEQPEQFYKLFEHFVNVNDIQLKTDMFAIAMAIAHVCRKEYVYLKQISKWIYHNIFLYKKIKKIYNAAIRYYSRAIMECAYSENLVTDAQIEKCRPPYRTDSSLLPFSVEATEGTRMRGYKTMTYDLARYVLCDPLDKLFLSNRDYKDEIDILVKKYSKKYHLTNLNSEKWILGSAFGYVMEAGWRKDLFYGKPNGGKIGEKLGLDIAISRQFRSATHGSRSRIMTITEKYIWCAKMELLGYLADRLPYYGYEKNTEYADDYGLLEDYVNPYQELCQVDIEKIMKETDWILREELTPYMENCEYSKSGIEKWIKESSIPDFEKWINIQQGKVTLSGYHCVSNEIHGVTTMMWISSGLIYKGKISSLVKKLKDRDLAVEFARADSITSYPASECYISPLEVCWFDWKEEKDSEIVYGNNIFYKNVAKCTYNMHENGEREYIIPSKKIRKMMGIMSGDGNHYYDDKGVEVVNFRCAGEQFGDSQEILLVDKELFLSKVSELGLQPVWVIRVLKEVSNRARERFNFVMEKDETYLMWKNSQWWQVRKIEWDE